MKPLDYFNDKILSLENAKLLLSKSDFDCFVNIETKERTRLLKNLLENPIAVFTPINELYFRSKWAEFIQNIYKSNPITLLEIASGDADMIPQTLSRTNPKTKYIAANMNVSLNESLLEKTAGLDINLQLIDDDAAFIKEYIPAHSVDIVAFQHGANDVMQAILCGQNNIDTINTNWMECLPKMIELLQIETSNNTFEQNVKGAFLTLINDLLFVLKKDGIIAISHYMFQLDLDWGYPPDLFENIIPIIRNWVLELENVKEIFISNFDTQWWIFITHK